MINLHQEGYSKQMETLFISMQYYKQAIVILSIVLTSCSYEPPDTASSKSHENKTLIFKQDVKVKLTTTDGKPENLLQLKKAIRALRNKEINKARKYLLPLTKQKYADAYYYMAYTYMPQDFVGTDTNLKFDWKHALPWLEKAADAGHAEAQLSRSEWNVYGFPGLYRPPFESIDWKQTYKYARLSAEQGYAMGQSWLARILNDFGIFIAKAGIEDDEYQRLINVYMWYTLASKRYAPEKRKRIILDIRNKAAKDNEMTKEQINMALQKASAWEKSHKASYKDMNPAELNPEKINLSFK